MFTIAEAGRVYAAWHADATEDGFAQNFRDLESCLSLVVGKNNPRLARTTVCTRQVSLLTWEADRTIEANMSVQDSAFGARQHFERLRVLPMAIAHLRNSIPHSTAEPAFGLKLLVVLVVGS